MSASQSPPAFLGSDAHHNLITGTLGAVREDIEARQAQYRKYGRWTQMALFGLSAILAGITTWTFLQSTLIPPLAVFTLVAFMGALGAPKAVMRWGLSEVKAKLVPPIVAHFGDLTYSAKPASGSYDGITTSHLLPSYNRIKYEDHISGTYRGQYLSAIQATAHQKNNKNKYLVFKGLIVKVATLEQRNGTYGLFPQLARFGRMLLRPHGWERIKLESDRFEDAFDFLGTDQIEGRTLMTPLQMQHWLDMLNRDGNRSITAIFSQSHVYLAFDHRRDFMDDAMMKPDQSDIEQQITALAEELERVFAAVDILIFKD